MERKIALAIERKQQLLKEIEELKTAIKELESNPLSGVNKQSEETPSTAALMEALRITEEVNKVKYNNVKLTSLENNEFAYEVEAITGPVEFFLYFRFKNLSKKKTVINNLRVTCYDAFIQSELKSWQNKCMRENSLQKFQRGVVSYGELFVKREEILNYLKENASEYFMIEKCVEEGKCIVNAVNKNTNTEYFKCEWQLIFNPATASSMTNFFKLFASNAVPFAAENKDLFTELTKFTPNMTSDRLKEIWIRLANNLIEAVQASSKSSNVK